MTETVEETSMLVWPIFMLRIQALRELNPRKYNDENNVKSLIQTALDAQTRIEKPYLIQKNFSDDAEELGTSFRKDLLRGIVDRKGNLFKDPMKSEVMRVAEGYDYPPNAKQTMEYAANMVKDRGAYAFDYESIASPHIDATLDNRKDLYFRENMLPVSRVIHNALIECYQIGAGEEDRSKRCCLRRYLQRSEEAWQNGDTETLDNDSLKLSKIYEKLEQQGIIDHKGEIVDHERFAASSLWNDVDAWSANLKKVGLKETKAFQEIRAAAEDARKSKEVALKRIKASDERVNAAAAAAANATIQRNSA